MQSIRVKHFRRIDKNGTFKKMAGDRLEHRKLGFKARGLTGDESRRRREEASVEIRKVKREETLNKRRAPVVNVATLPISDDDDEDGHPLDGDDLSEFSMDEPQGDVRSPLLFLYR